MEKQLKSHSIGENLTILCTNMLDEIRKFQRDKKKLARIEWQKLELLMEQVFVCGLNGYVEFSDPHFLVTILAWQHPEIGCYTRVKPEPVPNVGIIADVNYRSAMHNSKNNVQQETKSETCHPHMTVVGLASLLIFLRFLVAPSPWPEFHLADKLISVDQIVAEDRFRSFHYRQWVKDAHFPPNIRLPKPPPMAWSPDLIAFMALLFVVVCLSVLAHHFCSSNRYWRTKRMYHFAYKKL